MDWKRWIDLGNWSAGIGLALFVGLLLACSGAETPLHAEKSEAAPAADDAADEVLAKVGEVTVTRAEVEARVANELLSLERQRHTAIENGLAQLVSEKLVQLGAQSQGLSADELVEQEVDDKLSEPTDADVDAFYEARKAQINAPKEQVAGRIREFLKQQGRDEAYSAFIDGLKGRLGYESFLDPMRISVDDDGPAIGPATAAVTIVEFSDFECPFCSRVVPTLEKVKESYGDKVRLVFRQFPLNNIHPNAQKAAEASLCAHDQEKFWEMHDAMFDDQKGLGVAQLKEKASALGLDAEAFGACLDSDRYAAQVQADLEAGAAAGVTGTPAVFINGRFLSGAQPYEAFVEVIDDELKRSSS